MRAESPVRIGVRPGGGGEYPVLVGQGLLDDVARLLGEHAPAHRYVVVADATVAALYGEELLRSLAAGGVAAELLRFPPGERHKTRESWAALTDSMLEAGVGRDAAVLALGGGVTGDLAGFVAATYMRGIPLVQLPTSLLAMVDAAVGGKTAVDTPAGKNLVGAFHPPELVVADTSTLTTLPPRELRSGLAEAVKHGAIADASYLEWISERSPELLAGDGAALSRLVVRSVEIKARIVSADEREGGIRKTLNFGHTLGHAVESLSGYSILHGEAIAIGMVAEARLGQALGVTAPGTADRLRSTLAALGLPTRLPPGMRPEEVIALTRTDKKARAGAVEYALLEGIGAARWNAVASDAAVRDALLDAEG